MAQEASTDLLSTFYFRSPTGHCSFPESMCSRPSRSTVPQGSTKQALKVQSAPWSNAWLASSLTTPFLSDGRIVGTIQTGTLSRPSLPLASQGFLLTSHLIEPALIQRRQRSKL